MIWPYDKSMAALDDKRDALLAALTKLGSCAIAFSGGVDSAVVAKAAAMALGEAAVAVTGTSASLAEGELEAAEQIAKMIGIRHVVIATEELSRPEYLRNAPAPVQLLISDVQMPGLDGIGLAEAALKVMPGLRVLLMSGFADELGRAEHLRSKIARVISKPFTLEQIRSAVKGVLT